MTSIMTPPLPPPLSHRHTPPFAHPTPPPLNKIENVLTNLQMLPQQVNYTKMKRIKHIVSQVENSLWPRLGAVCMWVAFPIYKLNRVVNFKGTIVSA